MTQPSDIVVRAREAARTGQRDRAIGLFREQLNLTPDDNSLRLELGTTLYDAEKVDEAIQQLQLAKREPRCRSEAGYLLGQAFGVKKRIYALAVKELEAARDDLQSESQLRKNITYLLGRPTRAGVLRRLARSRDLRHEAKSRRWSARRAPRARSG